MRNIHWEISPEILLLTSGMVNPMKNSDLHCYGREVKLKFVKTVPKGLRFGLSENTSVFFFF